MNSKSSNVSRYRHSLYSQQKKLIESITEARELIPHPSEKGIEIEEKIREALAWVLPEKIGVSHGFVIDSNDEISKQMDIVLYDKMNTPKIYIGDHVQIFPVESTYACGEVKTKLDSCELEDVFKKCLSYKNLHRKAYFPQKGDIENTVENVVVKNIMELVGEESDHWKSIFFCITYESTDLKKLRKKLCEKYNLMIDYEGLPSLNKRVDTIVALNNPANQRNIILNATIDPESGEPADDSVRLRPYLGSSLCTYSSKHSWALFIALLLQYMVRAPSQTINMLEYNRRGDF